jgi:4-alpha-glucanotransferase
MLVCYHLYDLTRLLVSFLGWLEDAALFAAIDDNTGTFSWYLWPEPLKNRYLGALEEVYQTKKDFVKKLC